MKFARLSIGQEIPIRLVIPVVAAVLVGGLWLIWAYSGPPDASSIKAEFICGKCGHRFSMTGPEHHKALFESSGPTVPCPRCSQPAIEPVFGVCGACGKPIRPSDLDHSQDNVVLAQRLCPHCKAPMPGPRAPR